MVKKQLITLSLILLLGISILSFGYYILHKTPQLDGKEWIDVSLFNQNDTIPWEKSGVQNFFEWRGVNIYDVRTTSSITGNVIANCTLPKIEVLISKSDKLKAAEIIGQFKHYEAKC